MIGKTLEIFIKELFAGFGEVIHFWLTPEDHVLI